MDIMLPVYTWKKALLWGNSYEHLVTKGFSGKGTLGERTVHVLIGLAELSPIIGQIVSIAEKLILGEAQSRQIRRQAEESITPGGPDDSIGYTPIAGVEDPLRDEVLRRFGLRLNKLHSTETLTTTESRIVSAA